MPGQALGQIFISKNNLKIIKFSYDKTFHKCLLFYTHGIGGALAYSDEYRNGVSLFFLTLISTV